ncbi:AraC family transcriptional regulator [Pseudoflavonifractor capillosus]
MSQAEYFHGNTNLTISQIAQTAGYSTSSHFAELFRNSTGFYQENLEKST